VQLPPFSRHLIPPRSKYYSQNPVLKHPQSSSSLSVRDQVSHPYKTTGRIMVLYILTFTFLDSLVTLFYNASVCFTVSYFRTGITILKIIERSLCFLHRNVSKYMVCFTVTQIMATIHSLLKRSVPCRNPLNLFVTKSDDVHVRS
jgi:hypothetical protein